MAPAFVVPKKAMKDNGSPALVYGPENDTDDYTQVIAYINAEFAKVMAEEKGQTIRGYDLNYSNIFITESIVSEISNERPCVMLLTYAIDHWHRVICVGWRKYTNSNDRYWRIVDNWYNTTNRYFMPGDASIFSITSFWVS